MNEKYVPAEVEAAAQAHWLARDAYRVVEDPNKPKFYACSMLPYPSGKLHMGHVRNYTINDMLTRYLRMQGMNVLMPMGWDAFGLPAENAAIDNNVPPAAWTRQNIADMKAQMQPLGMAIDWTREVATCDPDYYKWNQWFFLKMLEKGIAYRKTQIVNWDPVDQTVLANEQVIDGRGWRSDALVEKREIPGYYFAITKYADELLANVADPRCPGYLHGWPERVRLMQEHWIGKSEGLRFAFPHDIRDDTRHADRRRPHVRLHDARRHHHGRDLLRRRARAPAGHPCGARRNPSVAAFIEACLKGGTTEAELATKEKEGVPTGLAVTHPITGEPIDVWVGNYVLMGYGDGAVMGVPAHDERDFAFARKYRLRIKPVIDVDGQAYSIAAWQDWYADKQRGRCIDSGVLDGLAYQEAVDTVADLLCAAGPGREEDHLAPARLGHQPPALLGHADPDHPLQGLRRRAGAREGPAGRAARRPGARRQRQPAAQERPVPQRRLPEVRRAVAARDRHDGHLRRLGLVLHALRLPGCAGTAMVDARNDYWMPMDQYIGGIEHAVLHLLYARFWTKAMRDIGLVKFDEPFTKLFTQGMLLNEMLLPRRRRRQEALVLPERSQRPARRARHADRRHAPRKTACR